MPTRYIPMSDDEQKFAALVDRVFSDQAFAKTMQSDPANALTQAGFKLTAQQTAALKSHKALVLPDGGDQFMAFPLTRPVVNIITKGTKPVVRVVTKGTQPAVQVAVNTVVAVQESTAHPLQEVPEETKTPATTQTTK